MNLRLLLILIIILKPILSDNQFFKSKLQDLKNDIKNVYKTKPEENRWHPLNYQIKDYPGTNEDYRKLNHKEWNVYYQCLNTILNRLGKHGSFMSEAVLGFPGGLMKLKCNMCLSPKEQKNIDSVNWYWASKIDKFYKPIFYDEQKILAPEDKTLYIYNLKEEDTGQYICKMANSLTAPYFITVVNRTINISEVHETRATKGPYALTDQIQDNFKLITKWNDWSPCSDCNVIGRKYKLGYCEIRNIDSEKTHENLRILRMMTHGIPCRSHILSRTISQLDVIKNRPEEVMIGYCKVKCPYPKIFEVKDDQGNVIEKANNTEGVFSMLQNLPPTSPPIERQLMYENKGKNVIVICPGNLNSKDPLRWQKGSKLIIPEIVNAESNGRIYISLAGHIVIKKSKVSDSNIYSCWQNNELAGTIRLIVEKKMEIQLNHHIILICLLIIFAVYLQVVIKTIVGRKHAKVKEGDS